MQSRVRLATGRESSLAYGEFAVVGAHLSRPHVGPEQGSVSQFWDLSRWRRSTVCAG